MTDQSDETESDALAAMSPEDREFFDRLMDGLQHSPAINCTITFNWTGNEELAHKAGLNMRVYAQLMQLVRPSVDFSKLKSVVFHHDYEQGIRDAAGANPNAPTPTKEAGGFSVGMLVRDGEGGVHLVMHEGVAFALASDDPEQAGWAQHIVRHELCHVDDFAFKKALIEKFPDRSTFAGFDTYMAPLAEALWDEFYANRYSHGAWSDPQLFLDLLFDVLPPLRKDVVAAILKYRTSEDLAQLRTDVEPKTRFVAQCFGYAMGTLAAIEATVEDSSPKLAALLAEYGLMPAWIDCYSAVTALDDKRPEWEAADEIRSLFPGCVKIFGAFGLHYRPYGEGAYIHVPETAETNPLLRTLGLFRPGA